MTAAPSTAPPPAECAAPRSPGEALALLAARRATGALHGPVGSLYLVDGQVAGAESSRTPGLAELLTGSGRITPEVWAELVRVHGPRGRVADVLVERQLLARGELELGHLGTLFDAAFFVLADPPGGLWRFEPDVRHWLGPVATVDPDRLRREVERRRRLLDRIWPWAQLDTAPVRPVQHSRRPSHRPAGRRRCELLDHADGRRTPADLARLLGRSGFGVAADIRRLAAAGLLDAPGPVAPSPATPPSVALPSVAPSLATPSPATTSVAAQPAATRPAAAPPDVQPVVGASTAEAPQAFARAADHGRPPGGLHRRIPGATLRGAGEADAAGPAYARPVPVPPTPAAAHPLTVPDPDIALLTRVRDLLEARL
ncbi:hypothetical protein [Streptomyces sp. NRRL S-350]|uniref:hypothetical protein n=1 Tax=Streptomyces sp. NRRL S-350 TaxID=1463902 RepID=UPI0007C4C02E|nr:hypothetical protein [Streptomyces sp. NRRL S-350]